jgi:PAS domain S-box-containing protein
MTRNANTLPGPPTAAQPIRDVPPMIGGGAMGRRVRDTDWSITPLGAYANWPQSLRSSLSLVLNAKGIAALYWGPEQWLLYNDAYGAALGDRHPRAFGRPMPEVLTDIAPVLGPQVAAVLRTGEGFAIENLPMAMRRNGRDEETIWTYSFSPVQGETGDFAGVLLLATEMTQQKAAERAGGLVKTRLETALRVARLGTFEWFPATGLVDLDARGREIYDAPEAGEVQAAEIFSRVAPEDLDRVVTRCTEIIERARRSGADPIGERISLDYDFLRPDGSRRAISSSGAVFQGEDGAWRMLGAIGDVTDVRRAEAQLREQNVTLEQRVEERTAERNRIWQVSQDLLLVSDLEGVFQTVNPAWTRVLGWTEAELVGRTSEWLEHPDDREGTRAEIARLAESGAPTLAFENRFRTRSGGYRHLSWTAVPEGGRFYCVARDVTHERRQAATLRASERRATTFFDFSNDYLFLVRIGEDGVPLLEDMNPACVRVMGLVRAEIAGRPVDAFLPENSARDIARYATLCLETQQAQRYLAEREYQDGHKLVIEGRVTFVERSSHGGGLVLFSGHDVTEQRGIEEALRQSQKMEAVGQLTGGLAHDFNNLLAGISGSLELMGNRLAQGRLTELDKYMVAAQGAAKRAAALTHRLLAFSRRQTLDPKPTDVNRLVTGMQEMIQRTVGPGIPVETVGAGGLWTALVDPSQLENALLNLCINARDAMPNGGRITMRPPTSGSTSAPPGSTTCRKGNTLR